MKTLRTSYLDSAERIVVKVGSGVLTAENGLNLSAVHSISKQICMLIEAGREVVLVSSGAMAVGMKKVGLPIRPKAIPERQAVAAVGQAGLIREYEKAFDRHGKKVAQVLLTRDDLSDRKRYLNARNTVQTLLSWKVVPIINENDTVVIEELKFGDNDNLSALITLMLDADVLINLTDIDGLYTKDPRLFKDAALIPTVDRITRSIEQKASGIAGALGTGGMLSKIKAARKVTRAGIPMIIARGDQAGTLSAIFNGEPLGTYFRPGNGKLSNRKGWIAYSLNPRGHLAVDSGAAEALINGGRSLLPIGITEVVGDFGVGACVSFVNPAGTVFGVGLVNYSAADIRRIKGLKSSQIEVELGDKPYDEVVHRDNLTVTRDG
jgi:glutamate 5-kinase